ncbi:MAG: cytochrome c, partial [Gemmatimonadales bacterium]
RTWSPMVEVLSERDLVSGAKTQWEIVPQMQVTLNTRQHVMLNAGFGFPVTDAAVRSSRFMVYLLWDWFDGGFFDGW